MGEYRAETGTRAFTPDDTPKRLHIDASYYLSLQDIVEKAQAHFGDLIPLQHIDIEAQHIQTACLGHDAYDPADHTNFIVLSMD